MSATSMPGYWPHETTGTLRPVVIRHLEGAALDQAEIAVMRAYLRQWMASDHWHGADDLRGRIDGITTNDSLRAWLDDALTLGIDPL